MYLCNGDFHLSVSGDTALLGDVGGGELAVGGGGGGVDGCGGGGDRAVRGRLNDADLVAASVLFILLVDTARTLERPVFTSLLLGSLLYLELK